MNISSEITKLRESVGWSKNKLAKESGLSQAYISQLEAGQKQPTIDSLGRICSALGLTLSEFFSEGNKLLSPDIAQLVNHASKLTPIQRELISSVMREMAKDNEQ